MRDVLRVAADCGENRGCRAGGMFSVLLEAFLMLILLLLLVTFLRIMVVGEW